MNNGKHLCRMCFTKWVFEPMVTGNPAETMTGEQLMNQPYAFDTEADLIQHFFDEHKITVKDWDYENKVLKK